MRITAILLLAASLQVSASGWGQEKISLSFSNAPLEEVLNTIKAQADVVFVYRTDYIKDKKITINVSNATLQSVLDICLKNQQLTYEIIGKNVAIRPVRDKRGIELNESPSNKVAGDGEIKGRVLTKEGEPLVSANVVNKRTGKGTTTDANGNFSLQDVTKNDILVVSYTGFAPRNVKVSEFIALTLVMEPAVNELDQVVMQAYGTTTNRLRTGNISRITSEEISKQPVMNVLNVLQGQSPGAVVTTKSGYASGVIKVEIRGRNTINSNFPSDPLYIIDGVPLTVIELSNNSNYDNGSLGFAQSGLLSPAFGQSPLFSINPADVESIEILKDADATAIYGSRASNGVILITTKKGKTGKTKFDLSITSGISNISAYYDMLNTEQYLNIRREAFQNDGITPTINNAPDLKTWDSTRYTDWQKYLWGGTGKTTDIQASLSGGDSRTTFRLASGYHYSKEITVADGGNHRGSLSFNLNHKSLNQRLGISLTNLYSYAFTNTISLPNAVTLPPNAPKVFDNNGKINWNEWAPSQAVGTFGSLLQTYLSKTHHLNSSLGINYEIFKGLTIKSNLGYNRVQTNQSSIIPIISQNPQTNPKGNATFGYNFFQNLIFEPQLEYNGMISKGKINFLIGSSLQKSTADIILSRGSGYTNDALLGSVSNAPTKFVSNNNGYYKYAAIFSRLGYNWENKYLLNFNVRRDGSSRFGPGRQFGNFGSIGAAWIFTEEAWIKKHLKILSFGKLRGSIGTTGGDQLGNYDYLSLWTFGSNNNYNDVLPLSPISHFDSLLQWQVNRKKEIGLSIGVLNDRINFEISYYRNRCNNQLVSFPTPIFTGFSMVSSNTPADVQNTGWEASLSSRIIYTKQFEWKLRFNIAINRNKLLAYPNLSQSPFKDRYIVGEPLNIRKLLHYNGVDPNTGLYTFEDKNNSGSITVDLTAQTEDDRYVYNYNPKFDGGISSEFKYKKLDLSVLFYFRNQIGSNALSTFDIAGKGTNNQPIDVLNHWSKPGDVAKFARLTTNPSNQSYNNYQLYSDASFTNASFVRLQNLVLGYSLSNKLLKKAGLSACRVYLQGQNLFVITNYEGSDPEIQNFGSLPISRIVTIGLSCNL